jgi:hypothetical protein
MRACAVLRPSLPSLLLAVLAAAVLGCGDCVSRPNNAKLYGYARVSTDGQTVAAQVGELHAAGAAKVYGETASGAKGDRAALAKVLRRLEAGDVLTVTRLDRLARSTRDGPQLDRLLADKPLSTGRLSEYPTNYFIGICIETSAMTDTLWLPRVYFTDCRLRLLLRQPHPEENLTIGMVHPGEPCGCPPGLGMSSSMLMIVSASISVFEAL